jgi:hypothetical protein
MRNSDQLNKLKNLLEGNTILSVEEATVDEGICRITTTNGTCFNLCATDLGFWTKEVVLDKYKSLSAVFGDYDDFTQYRDDIDTVSICRIGDILEISSSFGKIFTVDILSLNEWEQKLVNHENGFEIILQACQLGYMWKLMFKNPDAFGVDTLVQELGMPPQEN